MLVFSWSIRMSARRYGTMKTASAIAESDPVGKKLPYEVSVMRGIKKYIYVLPSGRKLKVIVDDEREALAELFAVQHV